MTRVGYDSDTGKYYFRDKDGCMWEGAEGAQYGEMKRISDGPVDGPEYNADQDVEGRGDGYTLLATDANHTSPGARSPSDNPYRMLFPFFLLIMVVLLLVARLFVFPGSREPSPAVLCPENSTASAIVPGDTCWDIAEDHSCKVEDLRHLNPELKCDALRPGDWICVPLADGSTTTR
ncbi:hypothetical protein EWM64_g3366 [Hericium alpestre]|uniref:LysM domain-containing protein n=1 Tax=Hericium alpestre TaxID=135208 RepID=A0A4Z0A4P6_9AGAM|nr:hypothetical protein EWM64_g3366 [Hericium alpestre]